MISGGCCRKLGDALEHVLGRVGREVGDQLVVDRQVGRQHEEVVDAVRQMQVADERAHQPRLAHTRGQREAQRGELALEVLQRGELFRQVILGHRHIGLARQTARRGSGPCQQARVRLAGIHPQRDQFGRRVAVRGPVHLVLHRGKKALRGLGTRVVVHARGVDVEHLAPEHLFGRADVADARQQLFKIVRIGTALEALVVQHKALDQVAFERFGGPLAELRTAR
jgi:hypothetical protein